MSVATVPAIESTVHTTNVWIKELSEELGWTDHQRAYHAFGAVLHALRDRLTVAETADLGGQLPMLLRGLYYEGWNPGATPLRERKREDFLRHIASAFPGHAEIYSEEVAWGVFKVLEGHVSAGEIRDVLHVLPAEIRSLWPENAVARSS